MKRQTSDRDTSKTRAVHTSARDWSTEDMDSDDDDPYAMEDPYGYEPVDGPRVVMPTRMVPQAPEVKPMIRFQALETDWIMTSQRRSNAFTYPAQNGGSEIPVLRFYGRMADCTSVVVNAYGVAPHCYVDPTTCGVDPLNPDDVETFRIKLNNWSLGTKRRRQLLRRGYDTAQRIDVVPAKSIWGYRPGAPRLYLDVYTGNPWDIRMLRDILHARDIRVFETNARFTMQAMIDHNIRAATWIVVPADAYDIERDARTTCDRVIHTSIANFVSNESDDSMAPFRIMSFDIECLGVERTSRGRTRHSFPDANNPVCAVINISSYLRYVGSDKPYRIDTFVLGTCLPINGANVHCYNTEAELLMAFSRFICSSDPDLFGGWNIEGFDFPYLHDRAAFFGSETDDFAHYGRMDDMVSVRAVEIGSKQTGKRKTFRVSIPGRIIFDPMVYVKISHRLPSYALNYVAKLFLKETKSDCPYAHINGLHRSGPQGRRHIATYCIQDTVLPDRILMRLNALLSTVQMARLTGLSLNMLVGRGQQIIVFALLLRVIAEDVRNDGIHILIPEFPSGVTGGGKFKGATVLEPRVGLYTKAPIGVLDFASLYPSIIIANNLGFMTLIMNDAVAPPSAGQVFTAPTGARFVTVEVGESLLSRVCRRLLALREVAKKKMYVAMAREEAALAAGDMMGAAQAHMDVKIFNSKQIAVKTGCNSVYGFTGAQRGYLMCLDVSTSVTALGRQMIDNSKTFIEDYYSKANGFLYDAAVIYGDTDSVFIKYGPLSNAIVMALTKTTGHVITTAIFRPPNSLRFEKTLFPLLLITKKKYVAAHFEKNPHKRDKINSKGIVTVRRDTVPLIKYAMKDAIQLLMDGFRNLPAAHAAIVQYLGSVVSNMCANQLGMEQYVVSKTLALAVYKSEQEHSLLARKIAKRDPGLAPRLGDRVKYIYVASDGKLVRDHAEDPEYAISHRLFPNMTVYLNKFEKAVRCTLCPHVLTERMMRHIFHAVIPVQRRLPSAAAIRGLCLVPRPTCLHCGIPTSGPVCMQCKAFAGTVYGRLLHKRNHYDRLLWRCWSRCMECRGTAHRQVQCANNDCPIYYCRAQLRNKIARAETTLCRFDSSDLSW